jgi:hypothetical protein
LQKKWQTGVCKACADEINQKRATNRCNSVDLPAERGLKSEAEN